MVWKAATPGFLLWEAAMNWVGDWGRHNGKYFHCKLLFVNILIYFINYRAASGATVSYIDNYLIPFIIKL